ncbi:hypothetical protein BLTE_33910 [Blastochloris tepida]|uniref:Uncharacterized protein n=1 Tax=Blastochloris tepida TaxID=2233851 RepID=A0A348G573_9HYPH|nr:hypothetical protein BLTE_33910 [Blastochloris tepida]
MPLSRRLSRFSFCRSNSALGGFRPARPEAHVPIAESPVIENLLQSWGFGETGSGIPKDPPEPVLRVLTYFRFGPATLSVATWRGAAWFRSTLGEA